MNKHEWPRGKMPQWAELYFICGLLEQFMEEPLSAKNEQWFKMDPVSNSKK